MDNPPLTRFLKTLANLSQRVRFFISHNISENTDDASQILIGNVLLQMKIGQQFCRQHSSDFILYLLEKFIGKTETAENDYAGVRDCDNRDDDFGY